MLIRRHIEIGIDDHGIYQHTDTQESPDSAEHIIMAIEKVP